MRITKKRFIAVSLAAAMALSLGLIPIGYRANAKSQKRVAISGSYLLCCQKLMDEKIKAELLSTAGIVQSAEVETVSKPLKSTSWLSGESWINPLTSGYSSHEDFEVQCQTGVGPVELSMRQETKFSTSELQVRTYSLTPGEKVKDYKHTFQLLAGKTTVEASVEIELSIELSVPWFFRSIANDRLTCSLDSQTESFAQQLSKSLTDQ